MCDVGWSGVVRVVVGGLGGTQAVFVFVWLWVCVDVACLFARVCKVPSHAISAATLLRVVVVRGSHVVGRWSFYGRTSLQ